MGYIFDALNNKNSQPEPDATPAADQADGPASDQSAREPSATLRLEDILRKHAEQTDPTAPTEAIEPSLFDQAELAATQSQTPSTATEGLIESSESPYDLMEHEPPVTAPTVISNEDAADEQSEASPFRLPGVEAVKPARRGWFSFWKKTAQTQCDDRLVVMTSPASSMAEEYRSIRTSILARHQNERHLVHTITSATPQEGKTITCLNLGLAFAELRNRKTIVVECDLRLPTFEKLLELGQPTGLIPYLHGNIGLNDAITRVEGTGLDVMTAGGRVSDEAVQMVSSGRMSRLIQSLRAKYDHVIIDTPPVVDLADAGILGAQGDEVLLVARMRRTPQQLVEQAVRTLGSYNAQVTGVIATDNPRTRGRGYGYRYGYSYRYTYAGKRKGRRRYAA